MPAGLDHALDARGIGLSARHLRGGRRSGCGGRDGQSRCPGPLHGVETGAQAMLTRQAGDRLRISTGCRLGQVGREIRVGVGPKGLVGAVGQVKVIVERDPSAEHRRIGRTPSEIAIPHGHRSRPVNQRKRRHVVVPHGRGQPPGDHQSLRGSIGRQRRSEQGLQAGPVRALPEPLDLGTDREAAGVEPEVQREPQPKPLGDLRQLRVQPEPPSREGLDVALFQVCPIDLAAAAKLPENRLERQHQVLGLRVLPARDINPTLADRLAQPFHARGITTGLVLDRQSRRQEGDRHMRIERTGQHAPWHRGVEQAEIHEIRIDRVEPLPGLGQNLEAGTQPVDGRRSVATLPGIGAGENLAGQGLVVDRVLMSHRGGQVAEQPVGRASARKSRATAIIAGSSDVSGVPTAPRRSWI